MNQYRWMSLVLVVVAAAVGASCGNESNENNTNGTPNAAMNVNPNNGSNNTPNNSNVNADLNANTNINANNQSNNVDPNNANNPTNIQPRTEPYITSFTYYNDATGEDEGWTINVIGADIANLDGNTGAMDAADAAEFETTHLGAATIDKMRNGWDCPDTSGGDMGGADMGADTGPVVRTIHTFEARIQDEDSVGHTQDITGCVEGDVPEVTAIIEAMRGYAQLYL